MATVLLGRTSAGTSADFNASGATALWKVTAANSGTLATIFGQTKVSNTATSGRMGIYADNGTGARPDGSPLAVNSVTSLTAFNGTGVADADVSASAVSIVSGTIYWIGWFAGGDNRNFQGNSSGTYQEFGSFNFGSIGIAGGSGTVDAIIWGEDAGGGGSPAVKLFASQGVG